MTIGERLKLYIKAESTSVKALALACDLPYSTLIQYVGDRRSPNAESLIKLVRHTRLNINWLLGGFGDMFRDPKDGPVYEASPGQAPPRPYGTPMGAAQAAVVAEGQQAWVRLKLGEAALLGGSGPFPLARRILNTLAPYHPKSLSLTAIQTRLSREGEALQDGELMAAIVLLVRRGLIEERMGEGSVHYGLAEDMVTVEISDIEQISHVTVEAVGSLVNDVMPAAEAGRGRVSTALTYVPLGEGRSLLRELHSLIQQQWQQMVDVGRDGVDPSKACEELNLVLGLSFKECPAGEFEQE